MLWFYAKLSLADIGATTKSSDERVGEQIRVGLDRLSGLIRQTAA
jgi:hypothetical protein